MKMPNWNRQKSLMPSRMPKLKDSMNGLQLRDKLLQTGLLKDNLVGTGFLSLTALTFKLTQASSAYGQMAQATETLVYKRLPAAKNTTHGSYMDKILILHTSTTYLDSFSMQLIT